MAWVVEFAAAFVPEFRALAREVRIELAASVKMIEDFGPHLGRPHVDTLKGSSYPNMKELRFKTEEGAWRVAFAFDPQRKAVILVAGDKSGVSQTLFYRRLIATADKRYRAYLAQLPLKEK